MHRGVASVWAMPRLLQILARYAHTSGVYMWWERALRENNWYSPAAYNRRPWSGAPGTYVFCVRVGIVCGCQNSTFKARGTDSRTE